MFPFWLNGAGRPKSAAEQRQIDQLNAEIAEAISDAFRWLARCARRLAGALRRTRSRSTVPAADSTGR
jgi:hypothetical protein